MAALYFHIPFCKSGCLYCDFYKKNISCAKEDEYIDALEKEMDYRRKILGEREINTIFFGGGTPSIYHPSVFQRLIDKAGTLWDASGLTEVTVEVNPDDATPEYLAELAGTDVNRISFGVQSFYDRDLQFLRRRHNSEQAIEAVKNARAAGFENISIDLIFGIPGQSLEEWEKNVVRAMLLPVTHISAYHLTVEPDTPLGRMVDSGEVELVSDDMSYEQYKILHRMLVDAGFDHYEISNFAREPKYRSKHNYTYWDSGQYLGLGPSAHSYDGDQRSFVVSSLDDYLENVGTEKIYGREVLSKKDKYNEFVMVSMRTKEGVRRDVLTQKFGVDSLLYFEYMIQKYVDEGLVLHEDNEYKIHPEKLLVSNAIISDLFYVDE